jgi:hypothetical protein
VRQSGWAVWREIAPGRAYNTRYSYRQKDTTVASYTITIAPEDGSGSHTTVRVDVQDGVPRITEYVVRSPEGTSLTSGELAAVDLDLLISAVRPVGTGARRRPAEPEEAPARRTTRRTPAPAATKPRTASDRSTPAPGREVAPDARAYRKLPDDLLAVFARIGSVTGLAAHYGVPRHTAQGWINRTRQRASGRG